MLVCILLLPTLATLGVVQAETVSYVIHVIKNALRASSPKYQNGGNVE